MSSPKSSWVRNGVKDPVGVPGAWAPWSWTGDRSDTELAEGSECMNVCKGQGGDLVTRLVPLEALHGANPSFSLQKMKTNPN